MLAKVLKLQDELAKSRHGATTRVGGGEEVKSLKEQNAKLRSIVLKNNRDASDVPDNVIQDRFVAIRNAIQRIVHRYYDANPGSTTRLRDEHFQEQEEFYEQLSGTSCESIRMFMMRAKIFNIVGEKLLSGPAFGAECDFENGLGQFEDALRLSDNGRR